MLGDRKANWLSSLVNLGDYPMRYFLLVTAFFVAFGIGRTVPSQENEQNGPITLSGEAVSQETISRLARFKVQKLILSGDGIDASVIEALRHVGSLHSLELHGGRSAHR